MTAPKMVSEREAVLRERKAACRAIGELHRRFGDQFLASLAGGWEGSLEFAEKLFPLPKIERPRVVTIRGYSYRVVNGVLEFRGEIFAGWMLSGGATVRFREDADALADLFANPTELVDDDGSPLSASRPEGRASSEETTHG